MNEDTRTPDEKNADVIAWCKKAYDSNTEFIKTVNHADNSSRIGLTTDQVKSLVAYVIEAVKSKGESCGSYRHLIYDVLEGVGYADGMGMDLLDLNNFLVECGIDERKKDEL